MKRCNFTSGKNLLLAIAMCATSALAAAQGAYPNKPIKLLVVVNPGGSIDTVARILGDEITKELKQPVIVENKMGAGGAIAATAVAKSPADGYTLLITHTGVMQADILQKNSGYRLSDLTPVAEVANIPVVFGVSSSVPVNNLTEFITLAKAQPGKYTFGSYGNGTSAHIWGEQFQQGAGIKLTHVPYKGEMPALQDVLAGHITSGFGSAGTYKQQEDVKKVRILAVANPTRSVILPNVPTFIESGFPAMSASGWCAIFAPAGTPKPIIEQLSQLIVKIAKRPDVAARILVTGQEPTGVGHDDFSKRVARDRETWAKAITDFKITIE
jgi:tripartite-type tricarboxylate transporter receptor subunit TctC